MCGIVGYIENKNAARILLNGPSIKAEMSTNLVIWQNQ